MDAIDDTSTPPHLGGQRTQSIVPSNGGGQLSADNSDEVDIRDGRDGGSAATLPPLSQELLEDEREVRETDRVADKGIVAEEKIARHNDAVAQLISAQGRIGDRPMVARIRESGLCDLARRYTTAALGFVALDALTWFVSLCSLLTVVGWWRIVLMVVALVLSLGLSHLWQVVIESRLRDVTSVPRTLRNHRQALWKIGLVTGLGVASFLLLAVVPSRWMHWVLLFAALPSLLCNLSLPLLAAVARSLGHYLEKPALWDALEYEIELRRNAIRRLQRFVPQRPDPDDDDEPPPAVSAGSRAVAMAIMAVGISCAAAPATQAADAAGDACLYLIDPTISGFTADRDAATTFLASTVFEVAELAGCRTIAVGTIGSSGRAAPRVWLSLPDTPPPNRCETLAEDALQGERGAVGFFRNVSDGLRADCRNHLEADAARLEVDRGGFMREIREALTIAPTKEWSRIRDSIQGAIDSERFRLIATVTDGIENPDGPINLCVPKGLAVVMILTRPSEPARYTLALAYARRWAAEPRLRVVSVGDLGPGFWKPVLGVR